MVRRLTILGLVVTLVSTLAAVAAIRTSTDEADAQATAFRMNYLCVELTTSLYKGAFSANCHPNHQLLVLPDDYPISLCASAYDSLVRKPLPNGACPPGTAFRIELPSNMQVYLCYYWATGRLGKSAPYPNGACGSGAFRVTFPFEIGEDSYQTLGNVDLDVPASDGVLANDFGPGLMITASDTMSASGGDVAVNPDGSFTYTPPAPNPNAFTGPDTFTYTVEDSGGVTEVVTVTIAVLNPVVWFVDADAVDPGDGRRLSPLNDLQLLNSDGDDPDNPGDVIYLYEATAPYAGGFFLEDSQTLVGQDVSVAEIIENELGAGSALQGGTAAVVPRFVVFPETDPTLDIALLANTNFALVMVDDTTAAGVTIVGEFVRGVTANGASHLLLDRVNVTGGQEGVGLPGVEIAASDMRIIDSEIFGGDAPDMPGATGGSSLQGNGPSGAPGGDALRVIDSVLLVSGSLVEGGDGLDAERFGGVGGDGIDGDFGMLTTSGSSLQGVNGDQVELTVIDSEILGGEGGEAFGAPEAGSSQGSELLGGEPPVEPSFGGNGGDGVRATQGVTPLSAQVPALQGTGGTAGVDVRVSNSQVRGGNGGAAVNFGGFAGAGVASLGVHTAIDQGSTVTGGAGGGALVDFTGGGGDGVFAAATLEALAARTRDASLQGPGMPLSGSVTIDAATVSGGAAGDGNATTAGAGGTGIRANGTVFTSSLGPSSALAGLESELIVVTVTNATVNGASGLNRPGQTGGESGDGITGGFFELLVEAGSVINGGGGGSGDAGGDGGNGISAIFAPMTINDSTVNGGSGGLSDNAAGAFGGEGVGFSGCGAICFTLTVTGSEINGGVGGGSLSMGAGRGGEGISGGAGNLVVESSTVRGGAPGADGSGRGGPAGTVAIDLDYEDPGPYTVALTNNTLVGSAGEPGQAPSVDILAQIGTVCVDATGNMPTGSFDLTNNDALSITQASGATLSQDNDGVAVNLVNVGFDCLLGP